MCRGLRAAADYQTLEGSDARSIYKIWNIYFMRSLCQYLAGPGTLSQLRGRQRALKIVSPRGEAIPGRRAK